MQLKKVNICTNSILGLGWGSCKSKPIFLGFAIYVCQIIEDFCLCIICTLSGDISSDWTVEFWTCRNTQCGNLKGHTFDWHVIAKLFELQQSHLGCLSKTLRGSHTGIICSFFKPRVGSEWGQCFYQLSIPNKFSFWLVSFTLSNCFYSQMFTIEVK